jgi:predicted NUDIX family NTP pyrophosphohydrolase
MPLKSAGILLYKRSPAGIEVLLVHPGGPYWARRDLHSWSIPKGEYLEGQDPEAAARREFAEETGTVLSGELTPLGEVRQKGGKHVTAFAIRGDFDPAGLQSNSFEIEWPPKSGQLRSFPEVDRAQWYELAAAAEKIVEAQSQFLDRLATLVAGSRK